MEVESPIRVIFNYKDGSGLPDTINDDMIKKLGRGIIPIIYSEPSLEVIYDDTRLINPKMSNRDILDITTNEIIPYTVGLTIISIGQRSDIKKVILSIGGDDLYNYLGDESWLFILYLDHYVGQALKHNKSKVTSINHTLGNSANGFLSRASYAHYQYTNKKIYHETITSEHVKLMGDDYYLYAYWLIDQTVPYPIPKMSENIERIRSIINTGVHREMVITRYATYFVPRNIRLASKIFEYADVDISLTPPKKRIIDMRYEDLKRLTDNHIRSIYGIDEGFVSREELINICIDISKLGVRYIPTLGMSDGMYVSQFNVYDNGSTENQFMNVTNKYPCDIAGSIEGNILNYLSRFLMIDGHLRNDMNSHMFMLSYMREIDLNLLQEDLETYRDIVRFSSKSNSRIVRLNHYSAASRIIDAIANLKDRDDGAILPILYNNDQIFPGFFNLMNEYTNYDASIASDSREQYAMVIAVVSKILISLGRMNQITPRLQSILNTNTNVQVLTVNDIPNLIKHLEILRRLYGMVYHIEPQIDVSEASDVTDF